MKWYPIELTKSVWAETADLIGRVPQYRHGVVLTQEEVDIGGLYPMCRYVRLGRLGQVFRLVQSLVSRRMSLFEPVRLTTAVLRGGEVARVSQMIPPPIIEDHDGLRVVINGHHRLFTARFLGRTRARVVVVRGDLPPYPADLLDWDEVQVTADTGLSREDKFRNLKPHLFRDINRYIDDYLSHADDDER